MKQVTELILITLDVADSGVMWSLECGKPEDPGNTHVYGRAMYFLLLSFILMLNTDYM